MPRINKHFLDMSKIKQKKKIINGLNLIIKRSAMTFSLTWFKL